MDDNSQQDLQSLTGGEQAAIECQLTDVGNGRRLAIHFGHKLRYLWDKRTWLFFDGHRWSEETGNERAMYCAKETALGIYDEIKLRADAEREIAGRWAVKSQQRDRVNAMLAMAQTEKPMATYSKFFDCDPYKFNALDWRINLKPGGGVSPQQPEHFMTKLGGCKFDETATCPTWIRCVNEWMSKDKSKVEYLQRILGRCLTGDTAGSRVFPIFHGGGYNGKSVCLDAIIEILGDYATLGAEDLLAEKRLPQHPCDIADLKGRRLVVLDETKPGMKLRTSLVKRMTGDKGLKGRLMRQNFEDFKITHTTILITQHRPIITETADAIWDRVHLLSWDEQYPPENRDTKLAEKLKAESPGILNWLIEGCRKWQADHNIIIKPESVEAATMLYREESDPLAEFVEERCRFADNLTITKKEIRDEYEKWAAEKTGFTFSRQRFNEYLRERGAWDDTVKVSGKAVKVFKGIGLQENLL
jgi:putative DNA primase/helicase